MKSKMWSYILIAISLLGIGISSYLEFLSSQPSCPIGFEVCEKVLLSPYSKFFGISLAILGMMWFIILLALTLTSMYKRGKTTSLLLLSWSLISIPSVIFLTIVELFLIESICIYCTISHILGLSSIIPAYKNAKSFNQSTLIV
ncbi:MAG: hypothetical protein NZ929_06110 [Aigarchaeota archaeon]|nr:hypothetical protein [Aigarchaeota archaeon]MCX8192557.1 hypothetical protein [Nitrososphaeria archaeon]MDW7985707.1 vitamin K epoxide reductase family protein [Nitrososphaerota archaeon]